MNHTSEIAALKRRNLQLEKRLAVCEAPAKAKAAAEAAEKAAANAPFMRDFIRPKKPE